ncbi:hypothetical protein, variant [Phialophora macrospora]|uniref:Uncharacterized protein n=1 Tax=Phialophora macrospora TaxID=1851006 RepID=A0A0D2F9I5_9EURO|nr:hypothetical protein PV04_08529 [Phialophora macrospora]KIW63536.1 hypothetical protein, variant [Phialophora macrospora]
MIGGNIEIFLGEEETCSKWAISNAHTVQPKRVDPRVSPVTPTVLLSANVGNKRLSGSSNVCGRVMTLTLLTARTAIGRQRIMFTRSGGHEADLKPKGRQVLLHNISIGLWLARIWVKAGRWCARGLPCCLVAWTWALNHGHMAASRDQSSATWAMQIRWDETKFLLPAIRVLERLVGRFGCGNRVVFGSNVAMECVSLVCICTLRIHEQILA